MDKFTVIVDSREQKNYSIKKNKYIAGSYVKALPVGDYTIEGLEDLLVFERKQSTSEISKNITEPRFPRLLEKMTAFKYKFLLCEFSPADIHLFPRYSGIPKYLHKKIRITPTYIYKWLLDIEYQYGITVVYGGDREGAKSIMLEHMKRIWKIENEVQ